MKPGQEICQNILVQQRLEIFFCNKLFADPKSWNRRWKSLLRNMEDYGF